MWQKVASTSKKTILERDHYHKWIIRIRGKSKFLLA